MDSQCSTSSGCCCLTNSITITQTSYGLLQLTGSATGSCSSSTISLTLAAVTTFQIGFTWYGESIRLQLGQDNAYLAFINLNQVLCSATAVRTSYNTGSMIKMNLGIIMFILLLTIGMKI